jgi:hypothetical protein
LNLGQSPLTLAEKRSITYDYVPLGAQCGYNLNRFKSPHIPSLAGRRFLTPRFLPTFRPQRDGENQIITHHLIIHDHVQLGDLIVSFCCVFVFRSGNLKYTQATLKFMELNTQTQQCGAVVKGRSLSPYRLRYKINFYKFLSV